MPRRSNTLHFTTATRFCDDCLTKYQSCHAKCPACGSRRWAPHIPTESDIEDARTEIDAENGYQCRATQLDLS